MADGFIPLSDAQRMLERGAAAPPATGDGAPPAAPAPGAGDGSEITMPSGGRTRPVQRNLQLDELGRVADPARGAPASLIASASLMPDPQDQIAAYARGMHIDPARFGVDRDGEIIYSDPLNNGQYTRVVPPGVTPYALSSVRPGVAAIAGAVGGMTPWAGGVPGAAVAAGGANYALQAFGRYLNNASSPLTDVNLGSIAGDAALNAGGQLVGRGIGTLFNRNPLGVAAVDRIEATRDPQAQAAWDRITGLSRGTHPVTGQPLPLAPGQPPVPPIDLDVSQVTGLASLRAAGRQLRRFPETMDSETARLEGQQTQQVPARFRYEVGQNVGPPTSLEAAVGENTRFPGTDPATGQPLPRAGMRGAAQDIIDQAVRARTAAAAPHYNAAYDSGAVPDVSPIVRWIDDTLAPGGGVARNSASARALTEARTAMTEVVPNPNGPGTITRPSQDYRALGDAKLVIDNILDGLSRGPNPPTAAEIDAARARLTPIQQEYTRILRDAHPEWDRGYQAYIRASPDVTAVQNDLGALANMGTNARMSVLNNVFTAGNTTPEQIARMRQGFLINGRMDEWNAGVSSWMEGRLAAALDPVQEGAYPNVAGRLFSSLTGESQRNVLRAALPRDAAQNLERFFDVLDAARRMAPEGSTTATDLGSMGANAAGAGVRMLGRGLSPSTLLDAGNLGAEAINALRTPELRRRYAAAFSDPNALQALAQLRMLSPTSERAIRIASQFSAAALGNTAGGSLLPPAAREPDVQGPGQ